MEDIYNIPGIYAQSAVDFQVLECLLESRRYLTAAIPFLKGNSRDGVSSMVEGYEVEGYERGLPPLNRDGRRGGGAAERVRGPRGTAPTRTGDRHALTSRLLVAGNNLLCPLRSLGCGA
ncbi:hypothetical protein GCM10018791_01210 [Streptomyces zaomyceticus]|nr:hypothetical protein GCM10018791_01210 [Streptomyces zaomyceticus]